ncbi:MAG TPA: hypothetical protein VGZ00_02810 [Candidatus Baltobacteraceae bacterium]|nr:hypothetical protein [Candidatus Baltobacteraceae bacterium]
MGIHSVIAFGTHTPEDLLWKPNTNALPAAISNSSPCGARSLDDEMNIFYDGEDRAASTSDVGCVKIQVINDVADPALRTHEVQRMGPDVTSTVEAAVMFLTYMGFLTYIVMSLPENKKTADDQCDTETRSKTKKSHKI